MASIKVRNTDVAKPNFKFLTANLKAVNLRKKNIRYMNKIPREADNKFGITHQSTKCVVGMEYLGVVVDITFFVADSQLEGETMLFTTGCLSYPLNRPIFIHYSYRTPYENTAANFDDPSDFELDAAVVNHLKNICVHYKIIQPQEETTNA